LIQRAPPHRGLLRPVTWRRALCPTPPPRRRPRVAPPALPVVTANQRPAPRAARPIRAVAVQSCILKANFETSSIFHVIGARVETRRLSAMGQGESTCTGAPTERGVEHVRSVVRAEHNGERGGLVGGVRLRLLRRRRGPSPPRLEALQRRV
jgi:hypothetical protein